MKKVKKIKKLEKKIMIIVKKMLKESIEGDSKAIQNL